MLRTDVLVGQHIGLFCGVLKHLFANVAERNLHGLGKRLALREMSANVGRQFV